MKVLTILISAIIALAFIAGIIIEVIHLNETEQKERTWEQATHANTDGGDR